LRVKQRRVGERYRMRGHQSIELVLAELGSLTLLLVELGIQDWC
jgi:hypothetical protein